MVETPTAEDVLREARARADADLVLMAAAISDYRPAEPRGDKRPKGQEAWQIELTPTKDVLAELGDRRDNGQVLVGFAADTGKQGLARAREKLERKQLDLVVFNDVARADIGFDAAENEVVLVTREGERRVARAPKELIAQAVLDAVAPLLEQRL